MTDLYLGLPKSEVVLFETLKGYVIQKNMLNVLTSHYPRPLVLQNVEEICEYFWNYIVELYVGDLKNINKTPENVLDFPKVKEIVQKEMFNKTYSFVRALDF